MLKIICAVGGAIVLAAAIATVPGFVPDVNAHTSLPSVNAQAKADRLDLAQFATCEQQSWPYYEAKCLRRADGSFRAVRMVGIGR